MIEVAVNNNVPSKQKEYLSHRVFEVVTGYRLIDEHMSSVLWYLNIDIFSYIYKR